MSNKPLSISLVIPVYNEESHLGLALAAALAQQSPFLEIIVVDNNSTDHTVAIVGRFPEVTLLHEERQGVVHARSTGFTKARGDIIARIDADTIIPTDWTQRLQTIFSESEVDAVSGKMDYYDMSAARLFNAIDFFFRRYFRRVLGPEVALQGANMALRKSVWKSIAADLCSEPGLHEDYDLAIHANWRGFRVRFDERLPAQITCRRADSGFLSFCNYVWISPKTYQLHGLKRRRYMYPVVAIAIIFYVPLKVLYRGYDPETQRFSLRRLFIAPVVAMRVNPATFVD